MSGRSRGAAFTTVGLDRGSSVPLQRQLYDRMRAMVLSGQIKGGTRLPSTRLLAGELGVSRNTVLGAYAQLRAEGYLEGEPGSGTYVARSLPEGLLRIGSYAKAGTGPTKEGAARGPSRRTTAMTRIAYAPGSRLFDGSVGRAFRVGVPDLDAFPLALWGRIVARQARWTAGRALDYADPAGYRPLREAIAGHAGVSRGVCCSPEQVVVISGAQAGLDLVAKVLLDPGDAAWIEDPGYFGARGALVGSGARLVPVPVDEEGLDVEAGVRREPDARLAFVTPSHQFPLGTTMTLTRRLKLLEWAGRTGSWVVEDDYDSEYRYSGKPLSSLQGLDGSGRVIYLGTFSKVLFPALRLGYLIVPADLVDAFVSVLRLTGAGAPSLEQAALAVFIEEGHFARHVRRMRTLYAGRAQALAAAARRELGGVLEVKAPEAGMHAVGWLPEGEDDRAASRRAACRGVVTDPLSPNYLAAPRRSGLLLGFAAATEEDIREGTRRLAATLGSMG